MAALESLDSLNGVDLMQRVGDQAASRHDLASESQVAAAALEKNRQAAQTAQKELTAAALRTRDTAVAAQAAVSLQLESKKSQSTTLVAQLAALNSTSVAKEQAYRKGQTELAAYKQAQAAKRDAAAAQAQRAAQIQQLPAAPNPAPNQAIANPAPHPGLPAPVPAPIKPVAPPVPIAPNPGGGYIPVEELLPNIPGGAVNDPAGAKAYAASRLAAHGWDQGQFPCLNQLWERESNWRTNATNPFSGAYGIAQALPPGKYGEAGSDWLTNYQTQITWGLGYIKNRYGSPCGAWGHSQSVGWY